MVNLSSSKWVRTQSCTATHNKRWIRYVELGLVLVKRVNDGALPSRQSRELMNTLRPVGRLQLLPLAWLFPMHLQAVFNDGFDEEGSYDIAPGIGVAIVQSLTGSPV